MKITLKKRKVKHISSILFLLIVLILLTLYPSVYYCQNEKQIFALATLVMILSCGYSIMKCRARLSYNMTVFLAIYIFITFVYWMLRGRGSLNCPYYLLFSFVVFFLFHYYLQVCKQLTHFFTILVVIIYIVALISIVFWIFGSVFGIIKSTNNVYMNWNGHRYVKSFYNIYFEVQGANMNILGIHLGRKNCAIFSEAPMASFIFSLALLLNINYIKMCPKLVNSVLVVAILSTFSTTGVIVLLMCSLQKMFNMKSRSRAEKAGKVLLSFLLLITVITTGYFVVTRKLETTSGMVRSSMIAKEFSSFLTSPLYGNGFGKYTYGSSNSCFALLADGGIFLWGIYYIPLLYVLLQKLLKKRCIDWFVFIFLCMFIVTVVQYYIITIFFITMFWVNIITRHGEYIQ